MVSVFFEWVTNSFKAIQYFLVGLLNFVSIFKLNKIPAPFIPFNWLYAFGEL